MSNHTQNPYSKAVNAYGSTAAATNPRMLENKVLLKSAAQMEALAKRLEDTEDKPRVAEIGDVMDFNQKLWILFADDACNNEHPLPQDLKNNIANLAVFVFKQTQAILIDPTPSKLKALIDINRNIAAGLAQRAAQPPAQTQPPTNTVTDSTA